MRTAVRKITGTIKRMTNGSSVLRGTAILEFADGELVTMNAGDSVMIARHVRHRVAKTSAETIWLAVHVQ